MNANCKLQIAGAVMFGLILMTCGTLWAAELKSESFDRDPGWEAYNNRVKIVERSTVTQDFGYSPTNFAGRGKGEIGGQITRASQPAFYGGKIAPKTLNDKLSASGTFAVTECHGGAAVAFGWYNVEQRGE